MHFVGNGDSLKKFYFELMNINDRFEIKISAQSCTYSCIPFNSNKHYKIQVNIYLVKYYIKYYWYVIVFKLLNFIKRLNVVIIFTLKMVK